MIKIFKPRIEEIDNMCKIIFPIDIRGGGSIKELYYIIDKKYKDGLSIDRGDGILVQIFLYAMKAGDDIECELPITERLYYQLKNYLIDALHEADKSWKNINIVADITNEPIRKINDKKIIATGMSCGVDSLCTYYTHNYKMESKIKNYAINLLTFFNVGAFHYGDGETVDNGKEYDRHLELAKSFAKEEKLPLMVVNSNLAEVFPMNHEMVCDMRNAGVALLFQRYIDIYYVSSSRPLNSFICDANMGAEGYSIYTLPNVSTDGTLFYSSNSSYTRVRKTKELASFPLAYRYLNVCTINIHNCGKCSKCVRTLTTLDAIGALDKFAGVFDLSQWGKKRNLNIGYAWASKKEKYYNEIYPELKNKHLLSLKALPFFILFKFSKPIEKKLKALPAAKRRKIVAFADRYHIRVPF